MSESEMSTPWFKNQSGRLAFTLVEMLVTLGVLVLIVVLLSQLTSAATKTIAGSGKHIDADTQARLIFNRLAIDFSNMIQRPDLDYSSFKQPASQLPPQYGANSAFSANFQSGGNDKLAFFAKGPGYFSATEVPPAASLRAPLNLIAYSMDTDPYYYGGKRAVLQRIGKGLGWEADTSADPPAYLSMAYLPATITGNGMNSQYAQWPYLFNSTAMGNKDADWKSIGPQIFRFEYNYLLKPNYTNATMPHPAQLSNTPWWDSTATNPGSNNMMPVNPHTSINGFQDVAAIVFAIAVLDLRDGSIASVNYQGLENALPDSVEGAMDPVYHGDIQAKWQAIISANTFARTAGIPQEVASAIHVYQRYFYLAPPQ